MATYYTEDHEWLSVEGDVATMGITAHAAEQLGDVVYLEFRDVGDSFSKGDEIGVVESVKAASEIYAPVDCEITAVNEALADDPARVNASPEDEAWLYKLKITDPGQLDGLLDRAAYDALIG